MSSEPATVVGGGLAGSEAAWQLARRGVRVRLFEMRPGKMTPAHGTGDLAELVCSNSLKSDSLDNASGLLKQEMRLMGSLVIACADETRVPAGKALAVDRGAFAALVTARVLADPLIEVERREVTSVPRSRPAIVATGPLTSDPLSSDLRRELGSDHLAFFDAAAPIVTRASIDDSRVFRASRYGHGEGDAAGGGNATGEGAYINCPMSEAEYRAFRDALVNAEAHPREPFERDVPFFEGCLPVEELARRGPDTLLFGPLKPVGLTDPRTGQRPFAVVQLRQDDREGTLFNMVGFQTNLRRPEQRRVFRMIPGLENAELARYGAMHRNTFISSPSVLHPTFERRGSPGLFFAGQITGVEGYVESAASGLLAGLNAARGLAGLEPVVPPPETLSGALCGYITSADPAHFQPMNANFGLLPPLAGAPRGRLRRNLLLSDRALDSISGFARDCLSVP